MGSIKIMVNIRTKGASAEREVIQLLAPVIEPFGIELKRNLEQTRSGGCDLVGIPGMAIEVKRQENLAINSWWSQTVRQALQRKEMPVLIFRQSRQRWKVCLPAYLVCANAEDREYIIVGSDVFCMFLKNHLKMQVRAQHSLI